jgi:nucleotide-binding universal stress UspA family protein
MNARGSTEVIVATIGLTMGALTQNLYTMIVTMAVLTTMAMPPMLRWGLRRLPISDEERLRLEKEDLDAKGFVSKFERLLIAADESANGKLASRMAGFIAGRRGIPVTVLPLDPKLGKKTQAEAETETALTTVATEGAKEGHRADADADEPKPEKVEVSARPKTPAADAVASEAPKGYDILFVGINRLFGKDGFGPTVDRITAKFNGPLALVRAGSIDPTQERDLNILVPINGTEQARRGAEIALALSPANGGKLTAMHVADRARLASPKSLRGRRRRLKNERALLEDISALAGRYGHKDIKTSVHTDQDPHTAILEEAKRSNCDLIVLGTRRRVGEHLTVGQTATSILEKWQGGLVIVVM